MDLLPDCQNLIISSIQKYFRIHIIFFLVTMEWHFNISFFIVLHCDAQTISDCFWITFIVSLLHETLPVTHYIFLSLVSVQLSQLIRVHTMQSKLWRNICRFLTWVDNCAMLYVNTLNKLQYNNCVNPNMLTV